MPQAVQIRNRGTGLAKQVLKANLVAVQWSPRSDVLAVLTGEDARSQDTAMPQVRFSLRLASPDGTVAVVPCPNAVVVPLCTTGWSPDGRYYHVVYSMYGAHGGGDIWLYDLTGRQWVHVGEGEQPRWSPSDDQLVYRTQIDLASCYGKQLWVAHIMLYDVASGKARQLTHGCAFPSKSNAVFHSNRTAFFMETERGFP